MEAMIKVLSKDGGVKAVAQGDDQAILAWAGTYEDGDRIIFQFPQLDDFYVVRADDAMDEALVYMKKEQLVFDVPFEEKKTSYNPKAFTGDRHYLTLRKAKSYELGFRNLAKNVLDQHGDHGCFPHAHANVETRGEAVFAARNAIDGVVANQSHGRWPYESWGINRQDDAEFTLEFGRKVDIEEIVLYTRADFPHDNWWEQVTFTFSDGSREVVKLEKSEKPHVIPMKKGEISWLTFGELIKADDPSPFPALVQIEVYGSEA